MKQDLLSLPIDKYLAQIFESLRLHPNLVLTASPGAGKTTRLPPALIKSAFFAQPNSKIIMLEPRRLAARAAASRIADEQGWQVGSEVGYQVRFENKTSPQTRLQILTEGIFAQRFQNDPDLKGVGCLILDEFHERSSQTDVALALARELQELSRPELRIVVMSATLETSGLSQFLGDCPIIEVPGLLHPIETIWDRNPQLLTIQNEFFDRMSETIKEIVQGTRKSAGNILVFMPGAGEIARLRERIAPICEKFGFLIQDLHGSLSLEQQSEVLKPSSQRKIILSTNIAESSLTVPGVATVVDSGLAKVLRQEGISFARLTTSRISKFSAIQRAGRSGREQPGINYRLWNKQDEASMPEAELPELLRTELSDVVLLLSRLGINQPETFSWFEKPSEKNLSSAVKTLQRLGAIDGEGRITHKGRDLSSWPTHPRIAALLEKSVALGKPELGARVAALLTERNFVDQGELKSYAHSDSDLVGRLHFLEDRFAPDFFKRAEKQFLQIAKSKKSESSLAKLNTPVFDDSEAVQIILLAGFGDRIARRRSSGEARAKMISGEGVRLHESSLVKKSEFFICLEAAGNQNANEILISQASPISKELIIKTFNQNINRVTETISEDGQLYTEEYMALEELPLEAPKRRGATREEAQSMLPALFAQSWDSIINSNEAAKRWLQRVEFAKKSSPELKWPEFNHEFKMEVSEAVTMGEKSIADSSKKDLVIYFEQTLNTEQRRYLTSEVPDGFKIPSGRYVKVDYSAPDQPTIEARLQEFFGWNDSPVIAGGKVRVRVQLLGPNYRPVQITSDLKGFWTKSYHDVRKELRARYPKHDWPENPLASIAKKRF